MNSIGIIQGRLSLAPKNKLQYFPKNYKEEFALAKANLLGMESKVTKEFFNVGSGKETKVSTLAETMMDIIGNKVDINYEPNDSQKVKNRRSSTGRTNCGLCACSVFK